MSGTLAAAPRRSPFAAANGPSGGPRGSIGIGAAILLTADHIAETIVWAVSQPRGVDVNTAIVRPIGQPV